MSDCTTSASFLFCMAGAALGLLVNTSGPTYAQTRFEMRPVETVTLSAQHLTGDKNGKSGIVAPALAQFLLECVYSSPRRP